MAEPQTMSKADVLATLKRAFFAIMDDAIPEAIVDLTAIAAWLSAACVVEGGHRFSLYDGLCNNCGQRRAAGTEGGDNG